MSTRYTSANKADAIKVWWGHTQTHLRLFLDVMRDGGVISDSELGDALTYFNVRIPEFEQAHFPDAASDIRERLLTALKHIQQSLIYRSEHNAYHAQLRLDMAKADTDAIRFRLIQFNILL